MNMTFLEARKIIWSYMGDNTYTSVAWRADPTRQNNQESNYGNLVEKLIQ